MTFSSDTNKALEVGVTYRFRRPEDPNPRVIDGAPNWYWVTSSEDPRHAKINLARGIFSPTPSQTDLNDYNSFIVCTMSKHRFRTDEVPWLDIALTKEGTAIYSGDSKAGDKENAMEKIGNSRLIESWRLISSVDREMRLKAAPVILVSALNDKGNSGSGNRKVEGLYFVRGSSFHLENQRKDGRLIEFINCSFVLQAVDLSNEFGEISMNWLNARRGQSVDLEECFKLAPAAWRELIDAGI